MRRDRLIRKYFKEGLTKKEICAKLLINNGVIVSESTVKRTLNIYRLFRRKNKSDILEVALYIVKELDQSGAMHGYRWMHAKCLKAGFIVSQEEVRLLLNIIDNEGVKLRQRRKLRRREYFSRGANFVWHIDGYDKIKQFGICIHGCVDGFSRFIVWLKAWNTNNDPRIIARYFVDAVKNKTGCPTKVRGDRGTENGDLRQLQCFLRRDHADTFAGQKSFLYGSSTSNQRIERFWGILRKECIQYWMDIFGMIKDELDSFSGDFLDKNLIRFTFMKLIQDELNDVIKVWNSHSLQKRHNNINIQGKPILLYTIPEYYGKQNCLCNVDERDIQLCDEETITLNHMNPCDDTIFELCSLLMEENNWVNPTDADAGVKLYLELRREIRDSLNVIR